MESQFIEVKFPDVVPFISNAESIQEVGGARLTVAAGVIRLHPPPILL